ELRNLSGSEVNQVVRDYLGVFGKRLSKPDIERLTQHQCAGLPTFLKTLLESLRSRADFENFPTRFDNLMSTRNLRELYGTVLDGLEQDYGGPNAEFVRDALGLLWTTRGGLSEAEIRDLLGTPSQPVPHAVWSRLRLALAGVLVERSGL